MVVLLLELPLTFITPFFGFCIRRFYLSVYVSLADLFRQLYFQVGDQRTVLFGFARFTPVLTVTSNQELNMFSLFLNT